MEMKKRRTMKTATTKQKTKQNAKTTKSRAQAKPAQKVKKAPSGGRTQAGVRSAASLGARGRVVPLELLAEVRLKKLLQVGQSLPELAGRGPLRRSRLSLKKPWVVRLEWASRALMTRLNGEFRGKAYPTDVLSFPAPEPFWSLGVLGDLVICMPVLKAQARELKHTPEGEMEVLLVHGFLHLLGFDHEKSASQAQLMAQWERKLLALWGSPELGLIDRVDSGSRKK